MPQSFLKLFILIVTLYSNMFAIAQKDNTNFQNEINTIKIELEKIKVIQQYSNKDNKLKEIENSIKVLEDKLKNNDIDKNGIKKDFQKYDNIINRQDVRIEDIKSNINFWAIGFSLIGVLTGLFVFIINRSYAKQAKEEAVIAARKEVKNWLDDNIEKELIPIKEEGNKLLKEIRKNADNILVQKQEELNNINIQDTLDSHHKQILEEVNQKLDEKEHIYFTFEDWNSKALKAYSDKDFINALKYFDRALQTKADEFNIAQALYNKIVVLGKLNRYDELIDKCDEIIDRFNQKTNENIAILVANSFGKKAFTLGLLGKTEESIQVYDNLIDRFIKTKNKNLLKVVAKALGNKIESLLILKKDITQELKMSKELFQNNQNAMILYSMFEILFNAQMKNQDKLIKEWEDKYENFDIDQWGFDELDKWNESMLDIEVKERIKRYIDIFKTKVKK